MSETAFLAAETAVLATETAASASKTAVLDAEVAVSASETTVSAFETAFGVRNGHSGASGTKTNGYTNDGQRRAKVAQSESKKLSRRSKI